MFKDLNFEKYELIFRVFCIAIGKWPFHDVSCQLYGFIDLVVFSGSTWILCIAAMER